MTATLSVFRMNYKAPKVGSDKDLVEVLAQPPEARFYDFFLMNNPNFIKN